MKMLILMVGLSGGAYAGVAAVRSAPQPLIRHVRRAADPVPRPTVVILMQLSDCLQSRNALRRWSAVSATERVEVLGILVDGPFQASQVRRMLDDSGVTFGVVQDDSRRLTRFVRSLGYGMTPVVVGYDVRHRLRFAAPLEASRVDELVTSMMIGSPVS
ncbi:MAG: hypothetical protein RQ751_09270 [Longimicrobiales bacterium]|nr:hypothetical protein [Longimicrobiales bacterium]